ncbi:Serine/threonine-protein kinase PknA [Rubripirellula lacrimiformis]|uniref:Serine/threonine-protein kinase PknA n=1 Tax=Rubripirellula lacrimiformis TaxID=1930273 RepID=A0A517NDM8_9BACT|nr:serine/threonine-protein kinase [Rubripirellula lacrimiformis]QDT05241.1 Serine/threonine-protein kinase PknA [Rubripirellula lacrimiformis]
MPIDEYLGPYKIGELIGRGGMGNVYSAVHAKTGERVAVKLIAAHVSDDPRFRRRFDKEIRALRMLKHRNIVRILGEGEDNEGRLFYSMELCEGETLQARIRRNRKLSWQETVDISIQIAAALKLAHDIGVTHRDLKPANLILAPDETVKLVDFGIPKLFGDDGEQTQAGSVLGTPDYMAPEQAVGGPITPRTDLYSLGSVMYAMLLGRAPFKGKNSTEVIDALRNDRPIPLDLVDADLPKPLTELVHHLLEKDPADRPPTALSVMNRLKDIRMQFSSDVTAGVESSTTSGLDDELSETDSSVIDPLTSELGGLDSAAFGTGQVARSDAATSFGDSDSHVANDNTAIEQPGTDNAKKTGGGISGLGSATELASRSKTLKRSGTGGSARSNAPETTKERGPDGAPQESTTKLRERFQTVEAGSIDRDDPATSPPLTHAFLHGMAVAVMVTILFSGGYLFYRSIQPPSADELYTTLVESGNQATMGVFLRRFPDDHRATEVRQMQMESKLAATLRRLNAQAGIGLVELSPAEEGFIAAMQDRHSDPQGTTERIESWIDAFDTSDVTNDGARDADFAALMDFAVYEKKRLSSSSARTTIDARAAQLLEQVQTAAESEDADAAKKKLSGIVETFQEKSWAKPAVDRARELLESL